MGSLGKNCESGGAEVPFFSSPQSPGQKHNASQSDHRMEGSASSWEGQRPRTLLEPRRWANCGHRTQAQPLGSLDLFPRCSPLTDRSGGWVSAGTDFPSSGCLGNRSGINPQLQQVRKAFLEPDVVFHALNPSTETRG